VGVRTEVSQHRGVYEIAARNRVLACISRRRQLSDLPELGADGGDPSLEDHQLTAAERTGIFNGLEKKQEET
jgi:hypothetical protein